MLLTTLFTSLFLCAAQITAKKQAAPTTTTAPAYGVNAPSGYIGVGVFDRTSLDQYATFSCGEGPFQTSGSLFGCGTEKDAMPTSCGGKGAGTLYYTDGFNRPCDAKEKCHTNILYNNKDKKTAFTDYDCTPTASATKATWTFYRTDPPKLDGKDGKSSAPGLGSGSGTIFAAVMGGALVLGAAIML